MILIGLASRFLDFFELPETWRWLENPWVLIILGILLVIEIVADKIPVVDTVNDWIQTIVRPAAGGIVFGAGIGQPRPRSCEDPAAFFQSNQWVPIVTGIVHRARRPRRQGPRAARDQRGDAGSRRAGRQHRSRTSPAW